MSVDMGARAVVDQWLGIWTEELSRAVEMFSGQAPSITYSRAKQLAPTEMGDLLWWKQTFEADRPFRNWIGAQEATWMAIGAAAGDPDPEAAKAAYLEILGQAQNGVANVIGAQNGRAVRCSDGEFGPAPDFHSLEYALIGFALDGSPLPSLVVALDPTVNDLLATHENEGKPGLSRSTPAPAAAISELAEFDASTMAPMLSRLMELELPLSVALGRSKMAISEVLKVNPGSVIELDRNVGEHVELIVHGTVVARGEVVSVRGNYGVRIKEIISRQDRMSLYSNK